jgi:putative SOS response-associated peptidase YedK
MRFKTKKRINSAVSLPRPELRNLQTPRPYQHNARTHSKRQIEQIARSIERFGFLNPVLIDASGAIICGHGRVDAPARNPQPRYNVCPTDTIDAVIDREQKRELVPMRWGLVPSWWPKALKELKAATFNARAETVAYKPIFRDAFKRSRCLIPASGYYEWHDTPDGKQPYYFTRRDGEPITIAGLWDTWRDKQASETVKSCAMIITDANEFVAEVHDRMPVILEADQFEPWLSGRTGVELLKPAANDVLQRWAVSRRVNSSRASDDDATLIDPLSTISSAAHGAPDLFAT